MILLKTTYTHFLDSSFPVTNQLSSLVYDRLRNHPLLHHSHHNNSKKISKRPRTILNAHQRKAFKYAFERGSKPSRKVTFNIQISYLNLHIFTLLGTRTVSKRYRLKYKSCTSMVSKSACKGFSYQLT